MVYSVMNVQEVHSLHMASSRTVKVDVEGWLGGHPLIDSGASQNFITAKLVPL